MKKTRTRIGSILLALALVLTLLPATALAAEIPVVGGELEAGTYTLTENTELALPLVVPANADVTIDLAGYTLDFSACGANCIEVYGALTIEDSSAAENGMILGKKCIVIDAGRFTLESGTIEITDDYGLYAKNDGEIVVNGGEITSFYAPLSGNNTTGDMNFEINAGVLTATYGPAIYMPGQVELTITGGTLNGGISLRMGQVEISGGTINAMTSGSDDPKDYYDYSGNAWLPDALYVFNGTYTSGNATYGNSLNMTITGGTFECENSQGSAIAIYDLGKVQQNSCVQISGDAELTTKASARSAYQVLDLDDIGVTDPKTGYGTYSGSVESSITGGTFSSDVSEYVADGYEIVPQGDQWVVGTLDELAVAEVGEQKYTSLTAAMNDALDGETVTLLADSTRNKKVTISDGRKLILDMNGFDAGFALNQNISIYQGNLNIIGSGKLYEEQPYFAPVLLYGSNDPADSEYTTITVGKNVTLEGWSGLFIDKLSANSNGANAFGLVANVYGTLKSVKDIYGYGGHALYINGTISATEGNVPQIVLDSATLDTELGNGMYLAGYAETTIDDSVIDSSSENSTGIEIRAGKLTINGNTTVKGGTGKTDIAPNGNGSTTNNVALAVVQHTTKLPISVTVNNGTLVGGAALFEQNAQNNDEDAIAKITLAVAGGSFSGQVYSENKSGFITGGYFTSDPTDYVASGYAVDVSNKAGYTYKVIEAGENTTVTRPSVEEPKVEVGGDIAQDDQTTVKDAVKETEVAEIAAAAVNQANKLSESTKNAAANQLKKEIEVGEGAVITIFVQTYLDIKPTAYDKVKKTLTLDITPMYQLVASTANKADDVQTEGENPNAVKYGDPKELTISGETEVSITLPNGFLSGSQNVYVKHSKDGRFVAYHEATIAGNVLTFLNDKGFSTFEITEDNRSATVKFGSDEQVYTPVNVGDALPTATAPSGQRFAGWTFEGIEGTFTTLTDDLLTALAEKEGTITATASFVDAASGGSGSSDAEGSIISVSSASHGTVRVNPGRAEKGDEVTVTAIPDEGYVLQSLTVTDKDGDTVRVSSEGRDKYTFTMPGSTVTVKAVFAREGSAVVTPEISFTDVAESFWAYNEIQWAAENGYMTGTTATTFNPGGTVTRQQVWMILARMAGSNPADMAAAKAWAVNNGISDGTNPGGAVTRQQLVALLYRFAGQYGYDVSAKADLSGYPDVASLASYAADAMAWSVANGIIGGTTAGTLNPAGTANRAQFAVILWRFYQTTAV